MKCIEIVCRTCGNKEVYEESYITARRKKCHGCSFCGNRAYNYQAIRKDINILLKENNEYVKELINEDKYNKKLFGVNKGFEYKKVEV